MSIFAVSMRHAHQLRAPRHSRLSRDLRHPQLPSGGGSGGSFATCTLAQNPSSRSVARRAAAGTIEARRFTDNDRTRTRAAVAPSYQRSGIFDPRLRRHGPKAARSHHHRLDTNGRDRFSSAGDPRIQSALSQHSISHFRSIFERRPGGGRFRGGRVRNQHPGIDAPGHLAYTAND